MERTEDLNTISHYLAALEAQAGLPFEHLAIIPVVTETALAVLNTSEFAAVGPRIKGMIWGAEDLSSEIGAISNTDTVGNWTFPYRLARSNCLLAATAAKVTPIDTLFANYRDSESLVQACAEARRDGFRAKVSIHPDQVEFINTAFSPTVDELAHANAIVNAFMVDPLAGVVGVDGKMYDRPHLIRAQKTIAIAAELDAAFAARAAHRPVEP